MDRAGYSDFKRCFKSPRVRRAHVPSVMFFFSVVVELVSVSRFRCTLASRAAVDHRRSLKCHVHLPPFLVPSSAHISFPSLSISSTPLPRPLNTCSLAVTFFAAWWLQIHEADSLRLCNVSSALALWGC